LQRLAIPVKRYGIPQTDIPELCRGHSMGGFVGEDEREGNTCLSFSSARMAMCFGWETTGISNRKRDH
jgi:hypothetical protein